MPELHFSFGTERALLTNHFRLAHFSLALDQIIVEIMLLNGVNTYTYCFMRNYMV